MRISEIAAYLKVEVKNAGVGDPEIKGVAGIKNAQEGDLTFLGSAAFQQYVAESQATALITKDVQPHFKGPQLLHKDPHFAYAKIALLYNKVDHGPKGVHPTAIIEEGVTLGKDVTIGAYSYVAKGSVIGDGVVLYPHVYIGQDVVIGEDCVLHPQTVVYYGSRIGARCLFHAGCIIGADGFGFAVSGGEICKIPQIGIVRIEDDVECGASVTIDRAASGETLVKRGCKFDDKVHIGHNVEVGQNCMFSAFSGIAGSTKIGDWVLMGGHSGVADHLHVASGSRIGAKTGVIENIDKPGTYVGFPSEPAGDWKRGVVYMRHMKDHFKKIRIMEERLAELERKMQDAP